MTNNNTPLLAAFGMSMGFSADDMLNIIVDIHASIPDTETRSPLEDVADVTKDMDARALFTGAILYGYILDAYENIDIWAVLNDDNRKT